MPVQGSIHWKPLRDSHYVVASLAPGRGGRRQLFIKQAILHQLQSLARPAQGQRMVGLLLGAHYECPITGTSYAVIESSVPGAPVFDESAFDRTIRDLLAQARGFGSMKCLGWYFGAPALDRRLTATQHGVHEAYFPEPSQTALVIADGGNAGAFFLHDPLEARWFQSPFYEELEPTRKPRPAKPTCVSWANYLTTDVVSPLAPLPLPAAPVVPAPAPPPASIHPSPRAPVREPSRPMAPAQGPQPVAARVTVPPTLRIPVWPATRNHRGGSGGVGRLAAARRRFRGVAVSESRSAWAQVREASFRLGRAVARRAPAVRASVAAAGKSIGKSLADHASSLTRGSLTFLARCRDATARFIERETKRRQVAAADRAAVAAARKAEAARQRAEAERVLAARRHAEEVARQQAEARKRAEAEERAEAHERAEARKRAEAHERAEAHQRAEAARSAVAATQSIKTTNAATPSAAVPAAATTQVADVEDTTASDPPFRFLALAAREGFVLVTNSNNSDQSDFWLLDDPDSGLLLTVITSDVCVREATLHYNLRTEDEELLQRTPPENRDLDARTIYVRESVIDHLRARSQHLRASGGLVREWKVSPPIELPHRSRGSMVGLASGDSTTGLELGTRD